MVYGLISARSLTFSQRGSFDRNSNDFVVRIAAISHMHYRYRTHDKQYARMNRIGGQNYNIQRITIFPKSLRSKSIIKRENPEPFSSPGQV